MQSERSEQTEKSGKKLAFQLAVRPPGLGALLYKSQCVSRVLSRCKDAPGALMQQSWAVISGAEATSDEEEERMVMDQSLTE